MLIKKSTFPAFALAAALLVCASMTQAQVARTWVSGTGDDSFSCSRTAPCKTFAGALIKTAAGGEINVLDPGSFGPVTINKAITIRAEGVAAGVLHTLGSHGIVINAGANDIVVLRGLDIEGADSGASAIRFLAGAALIVENCTLRNGLSKGIDFVPSGNSQLFVNNVTIVNFNNNVNGGAVFIKPGAGGTAKATLNNVRMTRNLYGLRAESGSTVALRDSVASNNTNNGVLAFSSSGGVDVSIEGSLISGNGINGIRSDGSVAAVVRISNNTITGNNPGLSTATGGQIISYGDNHNSGNVANNNGAPTSTISRQ